MVIKTRVILVPLFLISILFILVTVRWMLEYIRKYWFKLLENHCGNCKIPLQFVNFINEFLWKTSHVGPLLHFVEKLYKTAKDKRKYFTPDCKAQTKPCNKKFILKDQLME